MTTSKDKSSTMTLPAVESSPILLMRFTSETPLDLITFTKERLKSGGMIIASEEKTEPDEKNGSDGGGGGVMLGLTTTQELLEAEAEHVQLKKLQRKGIAKGIMESFTTEDRDLFLMTDYNMDSSTEVLDSEGLFTSSERVLLMWNLLDSIKVLQHGQITSNLSRKLDELKVPYLHRRHYKGGHYETTEPLVTTSTKKQLESAASESIRHVLQHRSNYVDLIIPVHQPKLRDSILSKTLKLWGSAKEKGATHMGLPIHQLRAYYGEEVAFYFAWLSFFTQWLFLPAFSGVFINIARRYRGDTVDTCELTPFHGILTFLWAVSFAKAWDRRESQLAYEWGTFTMSGYAHRYFAVRPEFHGEMKISPVTGLMEKRYPTKYRIAKYGVSALVTLVLLCGAFYVMIMSLNLQGYIHIKDDLERWAEHDHPFHYPFLSALAEEGGLFDSKSDYMSFVPVILHVVVVQIMNMSYRHIAEQLTSWENHETEVEHQNSLILKRFLFEAFDAYVCLFYLAFYERDVVKLRGELVSVFNIDMFRRFALEFIVPVVLRKLGGEGGSKDDDAAKKKKDDDATSDNDTPSSTLQSEMGGEDYEEFDDYLEMVIELGYVTLFASAYPLASFIAIIANSIEVRTDMLKLAKVHYRPRAIRTDSIGMWKVVIKCIIWLSALTNCLFFGLTSKQLMQFAPEFYYLDDETGIHRLVPGMGKYVVFMVFLMERVLVFIGLLIDNIVPSIPEDVINRTERQHYLQMEEAKQVRLDKVRAKQKSDAKIMEEIENTD